MIWIILLIAIVSFILGYINFKKSKEKIQNGKTNMIFGLKGSGKTTHAAYIVSKCNKFNIPVFSNVAIHGAYQLGSDITHADYPEGSVLIIDEAGLQWGNRDFKNFSKSLIEFFKLSRHHQYTIYLYSQVWNDCDKKIRDLTDELIYCKKMGLWSSYSKIKTYLSVDDGGEPTIKCKEPKALTLLFGKKIRRKKYYALFDSYAYVPKEAGINLIPW